ncbi:MAG: hypothetical protein HZA91_09225 [Verrucomicrobia bacterium]|nr:hypothetical protein [Verrucomicrobiota bacterium]
MTAQQKLERQAKAAARLADRLHPLVPDVDSNELMLFCWSMQQTPQERLDASLNSRQHRAKSKKFFQVLKQQMEVERRNAMERARGKTRRRSKKRAK